MTDTTNRRECETSRRGSVSTACCLALVAVVTLATTAARPCCAQDLEPRAYSSAPIATNFFVATYGRSTGSVVIDASLPIEDVEAEINGAAIGYGRTFSLFGRQALVTGAIPYTWGDVSGTVREQATTVRRSGLGDARVKLSVNLLNGEAMPVREFMKRPPPRTIAGASLTVVTPTGQYDPAKLVNLGSNRWAFKPEVGLSHSIGRWDLDAYGGVWFFSDNRDFFAGGVRRHQQPLLSMQSHVSYTFKPRLWAAFNGTWYVGGASALDGGIARSPFNNVRLGATLSLPAGQRQALKLLYGTGVRATAGSDFHTFAIAYQLTWFDRSKP